MYALENSVEKIYAGMDWQKVYCHPLGWPSNEIT